jgi:hypothetical protein
MGMEVLKIVAHLVITLAIIIAYVLLIFVKGEHDTTLQGTIFAVIGYWFGAINWNNKDSNK